MKKYSVRVEFPDEENEQFKKDLKQIAEDNYTKPKNYIEGLVIEKVKEYRAFGTDLESMCIEMLQNIHELFSRKVYPKENEMDERRKEIFEILERKNKHLK